MKLKMYKSFLTKVYSLVTVFLLLGTNLMPVVSSLSDLAIAQESLNETTLTVDNPVVEITPEVIETPVVEETEEVVTPQVEVVEEKEEVAPTHVVDETEVVQEETQVQEQVQEVEVSIVDSGVGPLDTLVENVLYTCNELSAIPCVTTDKDDYSPIELVTLNGYSYKANTQYELTIYSNDLPPVTYTTVVLTDENGDFEYKYQLDGKYRPHYFVEVSEVNSNEIDPIKNIVAKTTFKDSPISGCTVDSGGPDDLNANQKDLNEMCVDYTNLPTSIGLVWNWDDTSWSGNNSGDGCALLDSDGDGLANYALCVTVKGNPASLNVFNLYACNDTSANRCYGAVAQVHSAGTTCTASVEANANPFNNDSDTVARCSLAIADVSGAQLVDVCSYPSQSPNSSAEDCIIYRPATGKLEVVKMLAPTNDSGRFNLLIGATTYATNVGHNGSTGEVVLTTGSYTVSEAGYGLTDLSKYSTSIVCKDLNGTGSIVASGNSSSLSVPVGLEKDIVCTITNTVREGTLNVVKTVVGSDLDESNFSFDVYRWVNDAYVLILDDVAFESDGTNSFSLEAGTYKVEENSNGDFTTGYSNCNDIVLPNGGSATCTITNTRNRGTLNVVKTVVGSDLDESNFTFDVYRWVNDAYVLILEDVVFESDGTNSFSIDTGTYKVEENSNGDFTTGYSNCNDVVVSKGETETCTITNTRKTGKLVVYKDADINATNEYERITGQEASTLGFTFDVNGDEENFNSDVVLPTGEYEVVENVASGYDYMGWYEVGSDYTCNQPNTDDVMVTVTHDGTTEIVLCNQIQYSSITVNKRVDYEGNNEYVSYVKSEETPDFKWGLTESTIEYEMGSSQNLPLNVNEETYTVYETDVEGYTFVGWYFTGTEDEYNCNKPKGTEYPVLVELLSEDDNPNITLCNQAELGRIVVNKGFDLYFDEVQGYVIDNEKAVELGFEWSVDGENNMDKWGEEVSFDTGTYYIEEIFEGDYEYVGYFVGRGSCNQFLEDLRDESAVEEQTYNEVIVERGETTVVTLCNRALQPTLDITKTNDSASVKSSGENVEYTILVDVKDASVKDLEVTDLLPDEIKYQAGSFEVYVNDVPNNTVPEPTYNSPGTWNLSALGTLLPDDQVRLVYTGVVQNNVDSGLYKDLAFSSATSTHDTTEYANAVGTWSDGANFVGTEVEVANEEIEEAGVVLGTQTVELPRTGMNPVMIIISSILMLVGAMLVAFSYGVNLNRLKKFVMLPVFVAMMMFISPQEADASVAVRVQSIPSNINSDFTISYTTLNTTNNSVEVKCMVKKPSEVVFSQFGSTVNTINGGDAGNCVVDNSVLTAGEGIYEFKVSADGVMSDVVSTNYDITKPGTPINFEKINSGACGYDISFKTAADGGETVKVEIFRSTQKSFTADASTFAGSVAVGSNESKVVPQAKPVCDQTYYFAVRAVDNAGNTSDFVGDTIVVTEVVFVDAGNNPGNEPNQGGEVEGETDNDGGEIKGETDNGEDNNGSGSGNGNGTDDGDELGANDRDNNPINWGRVVGWFGGLLLGILVVWQLVKMGVFQTLLTKIMRK